VETALRRQVVRSVTHYGGALHRFLYRVSGGRIGGRIWGMRVVLLTTIGRRSRKRRTVALCALRDEDDIVVIASYGGLDRPPGWSLNLEANPEAELQDGRTRRPVVARTASGDERTRLWTTVTTTAPGYLEYERRTLREIAVVILQPGR
jgi:deazaflavin-dependent oxidoreductase (nitroreductase family)